MDSRQPDPSNISEIVYVISRRGAELRSSANEIDVKAAVKAVEEFNALSRPYGNWVECDGSEVLPKGAEGTTR